MKRPKKLASTWSGRGAATRLPAYDIFMIFALSSNAPEPAFAGQKNLGEDSLFVGQLLAKAVAGFLVDLPECYPLA